MKEESLFVAALKNPTASGRQAFLHGACAGDVALHQRVEQLLAAHFKTLGILDQTARPRGWTEFDRFNAGEVSSGESAGAVVAGRYTLLDEIGEGGMGTVWKAEQTQPVRRVVALKLIKAGMDSRNILIQFEAERQALALMDHPNIAKVLDGGTTENGRPFFVMEYVEGVPFTEYCDDARLSIAERLALFVQVCQAVQHAHVKGVIHRDLKPSNILIGQYDGQPVPKVIDFGLAKAMHHSLTDDTLHTVQGVLIGTPLYISPEQADFHNPDVDTRTDVYALGVILYELLTGTTPLERRRFQNAAWHEMLRLIKEEEPPLPSARLSNSDSLPSLAAQRHLEPFRLTKLVRGELDWIVMKCLEKDRSRRYETASGLARDIQRYLTNESVEACPPSARYRLGKFVQRNRGPMLAASIIVLLLVGGIVGTTSGLIRADLAWKAEANRAEGERHARAQAQKRLKQIERASEFLESVFKDLDPRAEEKESKPLRVILGDRLAKQAEQIEGEAIGDPLLAADLQYRLGESLLRLGMADRAIPLFEKTLDIRWNKLGPTHSSTLESMDYLAQSYQAVGKLDMALPLLKQSLELTKAKAGADHPSTLTAINNLAVAYQDAGRLDLAVPLLEQTLAVMQAKPGVDPIELFNTMNNLAVGYQADGKLDKALPLMERTLKLRKEKLGAEHPDVFNSMNTLALGYHTAGDFDRALPLYEETLKLRKAKLGNDHPDTLSSANNLASGYKSAGKIELAVPLMEESLERIKAKLGPDHPNTLVCMNNLAMAYRAVGKRDQALALSEESLERTRAKLGPDHPQTLVCMNNLATAYRAAGKREKALPLYEQAFELMKVKLGADHPTTLACMNNVAWGYQAAGKQDEALRLYEQALELRKGKQGADHPDTLQSMNNLAAGYRAADKLDQALPLLREAAAGIEKRRFVHQSAGLIINNLIDTQERLKQFAEAEVWRRKWLAVVKEKSGAESLPYADALGPLGANLIQQEKSTDAEPLLREALAIHESKAPASWPRFNIESLLGSALAAQKRYAEAESLLLDGYEGLKARAELIPSSDSHCMAEAGQRIVELYDSWGQPEKAAERRTKLLMTGDVTPQS